MNMANARHLMFIKHKHQLQSVLRHSNFYYLFQRKSEDRDDESAKKVKQEAGDANDTCTGDAKVKETCTSDAKVNGTTEKVSMDCTFHKC